MACIHQWFILASQGQYHFASWQCVLEACHDVAACHHHTTVRGFLFLTREIADWVVDSAGVFLEEERTSTNSAGIDHQLEVFLQRRWRWFFAVGRECAQPLSSWHQQLLRKTNNAPRCNLQWDMLNFPCCVTHHLGETLVFGQPSAQHAGCCDSAGVVGCQWPFLER